MAQPGILKIVPGFRDAKVLLAGNEITYGIESISFDRQDGWDPVGGQSHAAGMGKQKTLITGTLTVHTQLLQALLAPVQGNLSLLSGGDMTFIFDQAYPGFANYYRFTFEGFYFGSYNASIASGDTSTTHDLPYSCFDLKFS